MNTLRLNSISVCKHFFQKFKSNATLCWQGFVSRREKRKVYFNDRLTLAVIRFPN